MKTLFSIPIVPILFILFLFTSCGNKPNFMKFDVAFHVPLGSGPDEVGSNIPLLQKFIPEDKDFQITEYADSAENVCIFRNKFYIADKYNRRIDIFPLSSAGNLTNTPIFPAGEGYNFGIPFQVVLNKYGEIYVLASISNYMKDPVISTNGDGNNILPPPPSTTNYNLYYIYKFSSDGNFVYQIGINGINSEPMPYPDRIDVDLFDNVYAYFRTEDNNGADAWDVKRYSPSGDMTFEFNTKYVSPTNVINNKTFAGRVSQIYNLKNDERLMIYTENHIVKKIGKGTNVTIATPDEYYNAIDVYSVLQNAITKNVMRSKKNMDQFITITKDDILVLYSFDSKNYGVRFRYIDIGNQSAKENNREETYYAPVLSGSYINMGYYIDDNGQIYSMLLKDKTYYVIIKWRKFKSRNVSQE